MFIKYGDALLLCFFSFSFLTQIPLLSAPIAAEHHTESVEPPAALKQHWLVTAGQGCSAGRGHSRARPQRGERSRLYTRHSVNVSRHNRRPTFTKHSLSKSKSLFSRCQGQEVCAVSAQVLLLHSNCLVISGKISPTGKCTKLTNHHFFN